MWCEWTGRPGHGAMLAALTAMGQTALCAA